MNNEISSVLCNLSMEPSYSWYKKETSQGESNSGLLTPSQDDERDDSDTKHPNTTLHSRTYSSINQFKEIDAIADYSMNTDEMDALKFSSHSSATSTSFHSSAFYSNHNSRSCLNIIDWNHSNDAMTDKVVAENSTNKSSYNCNDEMNDILGAENLNNKYAPNNSQEIDLKLPWVKASSGKNVHVSRKHQESIVKVDSDAKNSLSQTCYYRHNNTTKAIMFEIEAINTSSCNSIRRQVKSSNENIKPYENGIMNNENSRRSFIAEGRNVSQKNDSKTTLGILQQRNSASMVTSCMPKLKKLYSEVVKENIKVKKDNSIPTEVRTDVPKIGAQDFTAIAEWQSPVTSRTSKFAKTLSDKGHPVNNFIRSQPGNGLKQLNMNKVENSRLEMDRIPTIINVKKKNSTDEDRESNDGLSSIYDEQDDVLLHLPASTISVLMYLQLFNEHELVAEPNNENEILRDNSKGVLFVLSRDTLVDSPIHMEEGITSYDDQNVAICPNYMLRRNRNANNYDSHF